MKTENYAGLAKCLKTKDLCQKTEVKYLIFSAIDDALFHISWL